jgi:hypothetical protein
VIQLEDSTLIKPGTRLCVILTLLLAAQLVVMGQHRRAKTDPALPVLGEVQKPRWRATIKPAWGDITKLPFVLGGEDHLKVPIE